MYWDASTSEKETAAFRALFNYLKDYWEVYGPLEDTLISSEKCLKNAQDKLAALTGAADYSTKKFDIEETLKGITRYKHDVQDANYQLLLFNETCTGNVKSMRSLLRLRKGYEYENWEFIDVIDPLTLKDQQ
jgi:hypothetical protein